jgi:threonine dehydratase
MTQSSIDRQQIANTYRIIRPYVRRTPVVEVAGADFGLDGVNLVLKLELLQHTGSFKPRGAFANLLTFDVPQAGVVAASGGNHGAAVAFAAMKLGKPAKIFVPNVASPAKIDRIRGYGADLVVTGEHYAEALAASQSWAVQSGAMAVHAYDQVETILGQGSVGLEFEEQDPALDSLLWPSAEAASWAASPPGTGAGSRLSASNRKPRQHSLARSRPGIPWTPKPEESPPTPWHPSASAN